MKTVELSKATRPLSAYAKDVGNEAVLVMRNGKPFAVLSSVKGMDAESIALANNPKFVALIERSRRRQELEGGISVEDLRRKFNLPKKKTRVRKRSA